MNKKKELIFWLSCLAVVCLIAAYFLFLMPMKTTGEVTSVQTKNFILFNTTMVDFYGGNEDEVFGIKPAEVAERGDVCTMESNGFILRGIDC